MYLRYTALSWKTVLSGKKSGKDFVRRFLQSAVSDFERDFSEWASFMAVTGEPEEIEKKEQELKTLLRSARAVLAEFSETESEETHDIY